MPLKNKRETNKKEIVKIIKKKIGEKNMKYVNKKFLTVGMGLVLGTYTADAAGTIAGTPISNQASVDYVVGGVNQTDINSNTETFVVDRKVVFTVTSNGNENVSPGESGQVLAYTINHTGNYVADFSLAASDATGDDFNVTSSAVFVESGVTPGYQALEDTQTYVDELAADSSKVVYIVSSIPSSATNTQIAKMHLQATAGIGGTASTEGAALADNSGSADTLGSVLADVQNVFGDAAGTATGDAANDGKHSDDGDYNVVSAVLAVTKSSTVISDGISVSNFKRIPGAVIEYTISIANSGSAAADSLTITDVIQSELTYNTGTILVDGASEDDDAAGGDETDPNGASITGSTITATIGTIPAGQTKNVVFRATVD